GSGLGDCRGQPLGEVHRHHHVEGPHPRPGGQTMTLSLLSLSAARSSVSSRLQKQKRIYWRPSALSWKKLEPGTVATPRSRTRWRAKATSSSQPKAEKSAM